MDWPWCCRFPHALGGEMKRITRRVHRFLLSRPLPRTGWTYEMQEREKAAVRSFQGADGLIVKLQIQPRSACQPGASAPPSSVSAEQQTRKGASDPQRRAGSQRGLFHPGPRGDGHLWLSSLGAVFSSCNYTLSVSA